MHIFPHEFDADFVFNSALDYELNALRVCAEPLLRAVTPADRAGPKRNSPAHSPAARVPRGVRACLFARGLA